MANVKTVYSVRYTGAYGRARQDERIFEDESDCVLALQEEGFYYREDMQAYYKKPGFYHAVIIERPFIISSKLGGAVDSNG